MTYEDGVGHAAAEIALAPPEPLTPIPSAFWIAPQPVSVHLVWHLYNNPGKAEYAINKRRKAFHWKSEPRTDLPNHVPPDAVSSARDARTVAAGGVTGSPPP